jgi:hypothetical protein
MDRNDLTLAFAAALVAAFLLGWILRWIFGRMGTAGPRNAARTADLATQLHAAEDARHRAETLLAEIEAEAARRIAELQDELAASQAAIARAEAQTEEIRTAYRQALIGRRTE